MTSNGEKTSDAEMLEKIAFLGDISGCQESVEKVLKHASGMLQNASGRFDALRYMSAIHNHLDRSPFIKNCPQFVNACITVLETPKSAKISFSEREVAYKLLIQLFVQIYHFNAQELIRDLSKPVSKFIQHFGPNVPLSEMIFFSKLIEACCKVFSSGISGKKPLLEAVYLKAVHQLCEEDFSFIKPYLETLSSGYVKVLLTGNFRNESRFQDALSKLMSYFEEFLAIFNVFKMPKPVLNFQFDAADPADSQQYFVPFKEGQIDSFTNIKRLYFVYCSLKKVLQESLPLKMEVPVLAMLTTFQAFANLFKFKSQNDKSLDFIVPELFQNIFGILETLVSVGKVGTIPFTRDFNIIIRLTVEWLGRSEPKMFLHFRSSFYSFLKIYFEVLGLNHNLNEEDFKSLVLLVIKNVELSDTNKIQLKAPKVRENGKRPKTPEVANVYEKNAERDKKALISCTYRSIQVLNTIFRSEIFLVNNPKYVEVYNEAIRIIINSLFEIYKNWITLPVPFQCSECRAALLETFWLSIDNCPPTISPPLETGIAFFQFAAKLERSEKPRAMIVNLQLSIKRIMESRLYQQGSLGASLTIEQVASVFAPLETASLEAEAVELKPVEVKAAEMKTAEVKKVQVKKAEAKTPEAKKPEAKTAEMKKAEVKKAEAKKGSSMKTAIEVILDSDDD